MGATEALGRAVKKEVPVYRLCGYKFTMPANRGIGKSTIGLGQKEVPVHGLGTCDW